MRNADAGIMTELSCNIIISRNGHHFLNRTKTELLREIANQGSLSAAAKKLKISYQHAWTLVDHLNQLAPEPLVVKQRGGVYGGGAEISDYGLKVLHEYQLIESKINEFIRLINTEIRL